MKVHEEAKVEINDHGNDLADLDTFARHLNVEINIIDSEAFNTIIYTSNKGKKEKHLPIEIEKPLRRHQINDRIYDVPYFCSECKKAYTKRDKYKRPSKCLPCLTYLGK